MLRKFFAVILLALSPLTFGQSAAENLSGLLEQTKAIQADFVQTVYDENNTVLSKSFGNFILQRPDKFYWLITKPMKQIIINDGKKIWNYQPDLDQVVVSKASAAVGVTPLAILSGSTQALRNNFVITQVDSSSFKLTAKQSGTFKFVWLDFSHGVISGMKLEDSLGQNTTLEFSNVQTNVSVARNKFTFKVPKDVDVVNSM